MGIPILESIVTTITTLMVVGVGLFVVYKRHGHRLVQILVDRAMERVNAVYLQDRQLRAQSKDRDSEIAQNFALVSTEYARRLRLESIQLIWNELLSLRKKCAPLVALEAILTREEFAAVIGGTSTSNEVQSDLIENIVNTWKAPISQDCVENNSEIFAKYFSQMVGTYPQLGSSALPFVDPKLWALYTNISQIQKRFCIRIVAEIEKQGSYDWRRDKIIREAIDKCGFRRAWNDAIKMQFGGFNHILSVLDAHFLATASNVKHDVTDLIAQFAEVESIRSSQSKNPFGGI